MYPHKPPSFLCESQITRNPLRTKIWKLLCSDAMEELTDELDGFVVILFVAGLAEVGTFKRCPLVEVSLF